MRTISGAFIGAFAVFCLVAVDAHALVAPATYEINYDINGGATKFLAVGRPSALKINGEGAPARGTITVSAAGKATGALKVDLSSFKTGIETRDHHMKEKYLEVGKEGFKDAQLSVVDCALPGAFLNGANAHVKDVPFKGKLKLHGTEKDVTGTVSLDRDGANVTGNAKFDLKIPDYGITLPSFAGITVAENVNVDVSLSGTQQPDKAEKKK